MTNVLPFRKKKVVVNKPENTHSRSSMKFTDCHFEDNGIGMLLGEGVDVDMGNTTFVKNGIGVVAGSLDERLLQTIEMASREERFKYAGELSEIKAATDKQKRDVLIKKSSFFQRLSTVADAVTVGTWVNLMLTGNGPVVFEHVMKAIMG